MINNLIIGAGQLGSRHLQGMLKSNKQLQSIYVIDPSEDALNISKNRATEVEHNHQLLFQQDWNDLPNGFDVAIIATNSNVREKVIVQLLKDYKVKYLILEKVLFSDIESYNRVYNLLKNNSVKTYVNHARRMFQSYKELKKAIGDTFVGSFQVTGGDWGLGCNGLHFIDLFEFISGSQVENMDAEWVDDVLLESKRKGFVEFTGSIKGKLKNGSIFQVTSLKGESISDIITLLGSEKRYIIQESESPAIYNICKKNSFTLQKSPFSVEFQSNLTTRLIDNLLESGFCLLPTFEEAKHTHMLFIEALLKRYNKSANAEENNKILPIT